MKYFSLFHTGYLKPTVFFLTLVSWRKNLFTDNTAWGILFLGSMQTCILQTTPIEPASPSPKLTSSLKHRRGWIKWGYVFNHVLGPSSLIARYFLRPHPYWAYSWDAIWDHDVFLTAFSGPHTEKSLIHPWLNSGWGCPKTHSLRMVSLFCVLFKGGASLNL